MGICRGFLFGVVFVSKKQGIVARLGIDPFNCTEDQRQQMAEEFKRSLTDGDQDKAEKLADLTLEVSQLQVKLAVARSR